MSQSVSSALGRFEVSYGSGCDPYTINVQRTDPFNTLTPQYVYEGDLATTPEIPDTAYTYTQPGTFMIYQILNTPPSEPNVDSLEVRIYETMPPNVNTYYCDEQTVVVDVTDTYYDFYTVTGPSSLDTVSSLSQTEVELIPSMENQISVQGYFTNAFPNCGVTTISITPRQLMYDFSLTSFNTTYICDDELAIDLEFSADTNTIYRINYFNADIEEVLYEGNLDTGALLFEPVPLQDPQSDICLRIDAVSLCSGQVIEGTESCNRLPNNFTAIDFAYTTYVGDDILLEFENNENGLISVEKRTEDFLINRWDSITTGFVDPGISPIRQYDYSLIFIPACGADTQRIELTPPRIDARRIKANSFDIFWERGVEILNTEPLVQLTVYNQEDSGEFITIRNPENPQRINLSFDNGDHQRIVMEQVYSDLGLIIRSNSIEKNYEYVVYVPRAFTPDGDGLNDRLEVYGLPSDEFRMNIYNKWGELIYTFTDRDDFWDGGGENQKKDHGVYTYYIEFENQAGEVYSQRGSFVLLKK